MPQASSSGAGAEGNGACGLRSSSSTMPALTSTGGERRRRRQVEGVSAAPLKSNAALSGRCQIEVRDSARGFPTQKEQRLYLAVVGDQWLWKTVSRIAAVSSWSRPARRRAWR